MLEKCRKNFKSFSDIFLFPVVIYTEAQKTAAQRTSDAEALHQKNT